jgi:uncharacterized protein
MSEPIVKVVQEAYAAFKRGDITTVLNGMSDDVGWFLPGPKDIIPFVGKRHGRQQVAEFFSTLAELQEAEEFEPREFIAQGDKVAVLGHYRWRVKSTSRTFDSDFVHVFTVRDGKVVNMHEYLDTHAAVAAYGGQTAARTGA